MAGFPLNRMPALSLFPGHRPDQLAGCWAEGNGSMSIPISAIQLADLVDSSNRDAQIDGQLVTAYTVLNADVLFLDLPFQELQLLALESQTARGDARSFVPPRQAPSQESFRADGRGKHRRAFYCLARRPASAAESFFRIPRASPWPPMRFTWASSRIFASHWPPRCD